MFPFEKILNYVSNEQCALVIGPDIMQFEGKPMNIYLREKVYKQYQTDVTHYYSNDGLFLFPPDDVSVKSDVAQALKNECLKLPNTPGYDEELLKTIAKLPFHLIISVNPDTFLSDTFYKYGIKHRFAYYRHGERPSEEVAVPTLEEPLIYNLVGSIIEDESLVLDYEDLFSLIGSSMGASGLPEGFRTSLSKIRTFIFIGFSFEKWYAQMFIRIISGKAGYRKYAGPHTVNDDTRTFLANQFKIDFWDIKSGEFWTKVLDSSTTFVDQNPGRANQSFLRTLAADPLKAEELNIIREIRNGQYLKALSILLAYAKGGDFENEVIQLSGKFNNTLDNQSKMDSRDFITVVNQIADAIVQIARQIAKSKT